MNKKDKNIKLVITGRLVSLISTLIKAELDERAKKKKLLSDISDILDDFEEQENDNTTRS